MSPADPWDDAVGRLQSVGLHWGTWTVIGSFVLYVLGYLTIRFHLSVLAAGTDLGIIDERYLFAGAKFVVYLVSAGVTLLLLLLVPTALAYGVYRLLSRHGKPADKTAGVAPAGFQTRWLDQKRVLVLGIVLAILVIQVVMKQCFLFGNLLLAPALPPEPAWLSALLIGKDDALLALFFTGLVASVAVTGGLLILGGRAPGDAATRALFWLLAFLVAAQILLLPINYGTLIADKVLPKVASLDGVTPLPTGQDAWLVWEGNTGMTYLVRGTPQDDARRSLVTLNRGDVKRVEILGYDRILARIFGRT